MWVLLLQTFLLMLAAFLAGAALACMVKRTLDSIYSRPYPNEAWSSQPPQGDWLEREAITIRREIALQPVDVEPVSRTETVVAAGGSSGLPVSVPRASRRVGQVLNPAVSAIAGIRSSVHTPASMRSLQARIARGFAAPRNGEQAFVMWRAALWTFGLSVFALLILLGVAWYDSWILPAFDR